MPLHLVMATTKVAVVAVTVEAATVRSNGVNKVGLKSVPKIWRGFWRCSELTGKGNAWQCIVAARG